jgi:hypothetical protein
MSDKSIFRVVAILFLIATTCIWAADRGLETFSQKIAATDHVIVRFDDEHLGKSSLSLFGEDAKLVLRTVSTSQLDTHVYRNDPSVIFEFWHGTNILGHIVTDGLLFYADSHQYRVTSEVLSRFKKELESK